MDDYLGKINKTIAFIEENVPLKPEIGIILGTGLGKLAEEIDQHYVLNYEEIPNFPVSTVESHSGRLIFGKLSGKHVVAMQGRFHYYEGYDMKELTFPVRVMKKLGIDTLLVSNASGGLNPDYEIGDLMILNDHINLLPDTPLRGKNYAELGPRFPDMLMTYDRELVAKGLEIAAANDIRCKAGVYVGVQGPCLETPAEYKYMHIIGGDTVGMSTVPEVIVARHMDMRVFAISVITDVGYPPERIKVVSLQDVIDAANKAEPKMALILKELIRSL